MVGRFRGGFVVVGALVALVCTSLAFADARTDRLVDLLRNSGNYRVRVQSAQSLGRIRDPRTVSALVEALEDQHPAVRASAAQALGRIGSSEALSPLRRLSSDRRQPDEVVSRAEAAISQIERMQRMSGSSSGSSSSSGGSQDVRFYIGVGDMGNTTGRRSGELEKTLESIVRAELSKAGGVKLAPSSETINQTKRVLRQTRLKGYFVQGSVTRLEKTGGQIQAVVSIMVLSNPGRDLRMMLQGRGIASAQGSSRLSSKQMQSLEDAALEGAVRGAITRLTQQLGAGR